MRKTRGKKKTKKVSYTLSVNRSDYSYQLATNFPLALMVEGKLSRQINRTVSKRVRNLKLPALRQTVCQSNTFHQMEPRLSSAARFLTHRAV